MEPFSTQVGSTAMHGDDVDSAARRASPSLRVCVESLVIDLLASRLDATHAPTSGGTTDVPAYVLFAPIEQYLEISIAGRAFVRMATDGFCLVDPQMAYALRQPAGARTVRVSIPRVLLHDVVCPSQLRIGQPMMADSPTARLLIGLLRNLGDELAALQGGQAAPMLAQHIVGFVATACAPLLDSQTGSLAMRARAYLAYVHAKSSDPELRPAKVAARFGISERYLRTVLSAAGESFSAYLMHRGLDHSARRLADRAWRDRTITEIAFESGFSNATHFGQAFKRHHGVTPRDYRNGKRAPNAAGTLEAFGSRSSEFEKASQLSVTGTRA